MQHQIIIDCETMCDIDLPRRGAYVYFSSPHVHVYLVHCYAIELDQHFTWWFGEEPPRKIVDLIKRGAIIYAHNAEFEWLALTKFLVPKCGWPQPELKQMFCTATAARACGLPGSLERAVECLGLVDRKLKSGYALMMRVAKPQTYDERGNPVFYEPSIEEKEALAAYCKRDVLLTLQLLTNLPLIDAEQIHKIWRLAMDINGRGVEIDVDFAKVASQLAKDMKDDTDKEIAELTNNAIEKTTQTVALKTWLNKNTDLVLTSVSRETLESIDLDSIPAIPARIIEARLASRSAAVAKYDAALNGVQGSRFCGAFVPYGAPTTGRWSSRRLQLHNFRRDTDNPEALRKRLVSGDRHVSLDDLACNVRGMIVPKADHLLIKADWSQIEARVAPWLARELDPSAQQLLDVFRRGDDVYKYQAAEMFNIDMLEVDAAARFDGKVAQLSLAYQGGWRALDRRARASGAPEYGEERGSRLVAAWRARNAWAVKAWAALNHAAMSAIAKPHKTYQACSCDFEMVHDMPFLRCKLPSGRSIFYAHPRIEYDDWDRLCITYRKAARIPKKDDPEWPRTTLFSGMLLENITQGVSACILLRTLEIFSAGAIPAVATTHDDALVELHKKEVDYVRPVIEKIMRSSPKWAPDLPLDVDVHVLERYQ